MTRHSLGTTVLAILLALACSPAAKSDEAQADTAPRVEDYSLALDGYCPVTICEARKWTKGDPRFGAVHRRRTFLFATAAEQEAFLRDPDRYTPILTGCDPIRFLKTGELVDGSPKFGLTYRRQVYLFTDEGSLQAFFDKPDQYAAELRAAMDRRDPWR